MRKLLIFASLLVCLHAFAQPRFTDPERAQKLARAFPDIERAFTKWAAERHMPGAVFGVIVDGELAWVKTHGVTTVGGAPVTPDSLFRIASMTKSFTAMSILQLRDAGKLSLEDPASKYVPELAGLAYPTKDSPQITIRHLLTHGEGFPEDNPWGDRQLAVPNDVISRWMKEGIPFSTTPGTAYEYSNYGFAILGQIIERVSGQSYPAYVREHILLPLGMTASTFDIPQDGTRGYRWLEGKWVEDPILAHGSFGAMGGLWTNARELAKYVSFLLSAYPPRDDAERGPIRRSSAREMQQAARSVNATAGRASVDAPLTMTSVSYGYGLNVVRDCRFAQLVSHSGGLPGYGSIMAWLPEHGVGVIAMGNVRYAGWRSMMNAAFDALKATGALEPRKLQPSPALLAAQADVTKLITSWDDALANRIAADNLFLDDSAERRKKQYAELVAKHGKCSADTIEPENLLRGTWKLRCERGFVNVSATLAPTTPPRVQSISVQGVMPPDAEMTRRLDALNALAATWDADAAAKLVTPGVDLAKLRTQLDEVKRHYGACRFKETVGGDGVADTIAKFSCDRASIVMFVEAKEGKVSSV
ncbi:MAG TPA: serine hydrolase domain-containing protein, partial [Thermoanaerobaculia bacterium]